MQKLLICGSAIALFAAPAFAQYQFETALGTALAAPDDGPIIASQALGFTFTMPGGGTVTTIDIDANGRILPGGGAELSDFSESTAELLTETHASICLQWDDMNMASASADDVYFNTNGATKAWVTWNNAVQFGSTVTHTMQCQLFSDGRIVLVYDSRCPAVDGLVGLSEGSGAAANPVDLSTAPFSTGAVTSVYQLFTTAWDLQSTALEFAPNGTGWNVAKNGVTNINGSLASTGAGCYGPDGPSFVYTPDGGGGYNVTRSLVSLYDANIGSTANLTGDDQINGTLPSPANYDLTFVFTFPGGTTSQFIDIDTNGRVLRDATETASDLTPTVAEFRTELFPAISVQADYNISAVGSDDIYFSTTAGVSARITWKDVTQFGTGAVPVTFQIQLFVNGVIIISLKDIENFNPPAPFASADDLIVGVSPGGGIADPGETDYMGLVGSANTGAINYELTDSPAETQDYAVPDPILVSVTQPKIGTSWDLRIDRIAPTSLSAWVMIGFSNSNIDLGLLQVPCTLRVNPALAAVPMTLALPSTTVLSIPIGPDPGQIGLPLFAQGITAFTGVNPFLPLVFTQGLGGNVGL